MEIDTDPLEGSSYDLGVTVKAEIKEEEEDENYNTMALTGASDRVARPSHVACERLGDRDPAETQNKMAPFTSREDEWLIELIYRNPPIYDARLQSYKDNVVRENIWEDIGKRMKKTSNECKRRWKYIRDSYNRCKRKTKQPSGSSSSSKITKWLLFAKLQFLEQNPTERTSIATVQDNYNKEENSEEIDTGTGKSGRGGMSGEESSEQEASNEGAIGGEICKAGESRQTMTTEETNGAEIEAGRTGLKRSRENTSEVVTSNAKAIGEKIGKVEESRQTKTIEERNGAEIDKGRTGLKRTRAETSNEEPNGEGGHRTTGLKRSRENTSEVVTSNAIAIGREIGKPGTSGLEQTTEELSGDKTNNKEAIGAEICEARTTELKFTREETRGDKTRNKVIIGGGIPKARTGRVQRKVKRQPKRNLQTTLLQYLKERDQQRQERIRTLTAQESDADSIGISKFCSYIGAILKKLTPIQRVEAKAEVFNLLTGYELKSLEQVESKSSFSPLSNVTCISKYHHSATVASSSVADPADLNTPSLVNVAPDDSHCEEYEDSTELDNNYFFSSM